MTNKRPTLLKVYIIPVLLLDVALGGWSAVTAFAAHGLPIFLGYALIATIGLYLYMMYLGHYLS